jgi:hypothetical protein
MFSPPGPRATPRKLLLSLRGRQIHSTIFKIFLAKRNRPPKRAIKNFETLKR